MNCPSKGITKAKPRPSLPPQKVAFQNRNKGQPKKGDCSQLQKIPVNFASMKDKIEEQAQIYHQYSILEAQENYEERISDKA